MKNAFTSRSVLCAFALLATGSEAYPTFEWKHIKPHGWPYHWYSNSSSDATIGTGVLLASTQTTVLATVSVASTTDPASVAASSPNVELATTSSLESVAKPSTVAAASTDTIPSSTSASATNTASPLPFKAGLSGYVGITSKQAFKDLSPYISWYSDYTPTTSSVDGVKGIPMLWGDGVSCSSSSGDAERMSTFDNLTTTPEFMLGFYEPDCNCPASSYMTTADGTSIWNEKLAPLASKGTLLGSPSMCKQYSEDWLTPFSIDTSTKKSLLDAEWRYTSIHINKNNIDGVMKDVGYYWVKYGRPIWVSEFACVDDVNGFAPCTNQTEIDQFISDAVDFFHSNASVIAFGASNGEGLGTVWPLIDSQTGELTATGTTYLNKLKSL